MIIVHIISASFLIYSIWQWWTICVSLTYYMDSLPLVRLGYLTLYGLILLQYGIDPHILFILLTTATLVTSVNFLYEYGFTTFRTVEQRNADNDKIVNRAITEARKKVKKNSQG